MIVSVHIPKTGGSSLTRQIEQGAFGAFLLDYADRPRSRRLKRIAQRTWSRWTVPLRAAALRRYGIVHGHFPVSKYRSVGDAFMVFLRDPVQRTLSHFNYLKSVAGQWPERRRRFPLMRDIAEGRLDLVAFAEQNRDFYRTFLGDVDFADFDVVGLTEDYERSIALVNARFRVSLQPLRERYLEHDRTHVPELERLNEENYHYYHLARRRHEQLVAEFL